MSKTHSSTSDRHVNGTSTVRLPRARALRALRLLEQGRPTTVYGMAERRAIIESLRAAVGGGR